MKLLGSFCSCESYRDEFGIPFQVTGQVQLLSGSVVNFGLAECSSSELELMASDFIMDNATLLVRCHPSISISAHECLKQYG